MSSITIKVEDGEAGTVALHSFARSPVRIGRSALNNLTLDRPFVSGYHAVARFDENGVTLADLGSRNGTIVDGVTLDKNVPAIVTKDSEVKIGSLRLTLAVFDDVLPQAPQRAGIVQIAQPGPVAEASGMGWQAGTQSGPPAPYPPAPYPPAPSRVSEPVPVASGPGPEPAATLRASVPAVGQTRMIVDGEVARVMQDMAVRPSLPPSSPAPAAPEPLPPPGGAAVRRSPPAGVVAATGPISRETLARTPPEILVDTLETFARGFIELRKGYQEFGSEMGLRPVTGSTPLHRTREPREILQYLLDSQGDRRARLQELVNIFADFMIHELALMNGIKEGLRNLVSELDPELVENARRSKGLRLFDGGKALDRYAEHFRQLTEDGGHSVVFGTAFARAYAAAVGNRKSEE